MRFDSQLLIGTDRRDSSDHGFKATYIDEEGGMQSLPFDYNQTESNAVTIKNPHFKPDLHAAEQ